MLKKLSTYYIVFGFGSFIIALYLITRFLGLSDFPIFTDEAIYVRWAQIAKNDAIWRFISLTDGKQPMFVWIAMVFMRFIDSPLLAARLVSVISGLFTVVGLFLVGRKAFRSNAVGLTASFLYAVYPFALVYDKMALYDSLVGTFAVWSLYFSLLLATYVRLDIVFILGLVIGGGVLTKTSSFFSLLLLPVNALLLDLNSKNRVKVLTSFFLMCGLVAGLTFMYYCVLRLSPFFHIVSDKNAIFVYPFGEWMQHPFYYLSNNFFGLWDWFWKYMSIPWVVLVGLSLIISKSYTKEKIVLLLYFLVPFLYLSFFGRTIYPRFIFFMTLPLLPLVAFSAVQVYQKIKNTLLAKVILALLLVLPLRADYFILFDFANAPIPRPDIDQYYTDWPSGLGVSQAVAFFKKESEKGKIYIGTQGTFGLMPYSLEIFLVDNPNITIKGFWPIETSLPKELDDARRKYPTYFVAYQPCLNCAQKGIAPTSWPLKVKIQVQKKTPDALFTVYQVTP